MAACYADLAASHVGAPGLAVGAPGFPHEGWGLAYSG
jgi:hypothetical protein